jgi:predicted nucleic acid-binding protein
MGRCQTRPLRRWGLAPLPGPDDQKFIDLALLGGATWLVSRDKAVLKLARRCRAQAGLVVTPPHLWAPLATA